MRIKKLLKNIDYISAAFADDFEVRGISCNSKSLKPGYFFVAVKGSLVDGNQFIDEAITNGAKAVVFEGNASLREGVNFIKVKDTRTALAKLADAFYGHPSRGIKVVGITGTNAKTTITYLLEAIAKEAKRPSGVIGTINYRFKNKVIPAKNTTPGPIELQSALAGMHKAGAKYCFMEVSSHALDQDRVGEIDFSSAIFTNLTQDHLDYHKTLENYFLSKARLFKGLKRGSFAVINNDDCHGRRLLKLTKAKTATYGINNKSDVMARNIRFNCGGSEFALTAKGLEMDLKTRLIGIHSVYNILAVSAWALQEGLSADVVRSAVSKFAYVPGRLEKVQVNKGYSVFVDYAHTEDALKNVISSLRQLCDKRIIVVFGCGGDRDKTKRPKMGHVVTELADYAIITSDNPRSEDPLEIIKDVKRGISKRNFCAIPERREAIRKSLSMAGSGDIVLLAGKGHETYQVLKDGTVHFNDKEVVIKCLK